MLAEDRQNTIVALVNENGSVLVKELSERFSVTEDSIRKDLALLQRRGLLKKTYGGAVRVRVNPHDRHVTQRRGKNLAEKQRIARRAAALIEDGEMVFLDISTANLELARLLAAEDRPLTVVTNMIDIMLAFSAGGRVKLIFLGGCFSDGRDGFVGALTNQQLKSFRFDKAFMGVVGVDLEGDRVTTYTAEDATTKRAVLEASNRAFMMLETRKLTAEGNYIYARVDDFSGAVMEKEASPSLQKQMQRYAVDWMV